MADSAPPAGLVIRPASDRDFEALVDLDMSSGIHHAALDPDVYQLPERAAMAAFLRRRLDMPNREVIVAEIRGAVVGMVDVALIDDPNPGSIIRPLTTADIGISVLNGWRKHGIGHALMEAAEESARRRGASRIVLDVSAANVDALRFYHQIGYVEYGLLLRRTLD